MKKNLYLLVLLLSVAAVPIVLHAVEFPVTHLPGASFSLSDSSGSYTLTIVDSTRVNQYSVASDSVTFTLGNGAIVELVSPDRYLFHLNGAPCAPITKSCSPTESRLLVQCFNIEEGTTQTLSVSRESTSTCTTSNQSGSAGSSSTGVSSPGPSAPPAGEKKTEVKKEVLPANVEIITIPIQSPTEVVVGSSSHTVTVSTASALSATLTIQSKPITITVAKDKPQEVDTNGDGKKDLKVTYLGLVNGNPKFKFEDLIVAVKKKTVVPAVPKIEQTFTKGTPATVSVDGNIHTVTLTKVTKKGYVTIALKDGKPAKFTLNKAGQSKKVDTNADGKADLLVKYKKLTDGKIMLEFSPIKAATSKSTPAPAVASKTTPSYVFTTDLKSGSSGEAVKQLQIKLKTLGFFPAATAPNGNYGPMTTDAVKKFQKANGLPDLGTVGSATRELLNKK